MNRRMKTITAALTIAAAGAVIAPLSAHAEDTLPVQRPFSLKIGAQFPSSSTALYVGGSYDFSKSTGTNPNLYQLYVDYGSKDSSRYLLGYGVAAKFVLAPAISTAQPYAGLGIGGYTSKVGGSSTKTNLGGKVFAGYQLNSGVFAEADYSLTNKNNGQDPSAFGLRLGYRF